MTSEESTDGTGRDPLSPKEITAQFDDLEAGDSLVVNNRETVYTVVETDTYSVTAEDAAGHRVTFSQNLQTGGWAINEEVFFVETTR